MSERCQGTFHNRLRQTGGGSRTVAIADQPGRGASEGGVALLVSLMLIVILSLMAFALVTRSFVASRVAGVERFRTRTFYAADSGINGARARLSIGKIDGFCFDDSNLGGPPADIGGRPIEVAVSSLLLAGPPRAVVGSQVGGGQGSDSESLCAVVYRGYSRASHGPTGCRSVVSATLSLGPVPLSSVMSRESNRVGGGGQ